MPQFSVKVIAKTLRRPIISLPSVKILVKKHREERGEVKSTTNINGECTFSLEAGEWIFSTDIPRFPGTPPRLFQNPEMGVSLNNGNAVVVLKVLDAGQDCLVITRRLKKHLKDGQYDKAHKLVKNIKSFYNNYQQIPELTYFVSLEALLGEASQGKNIADALNSIIIPRVWPRNSVETTSNQRSV